MTTTVAAPSTRAVGERTVGKLRRRLIPFLFLLYVVAYVDRVNVGYAAIKMNHDLGFSAGVYGLAAGLFFVGYFIFEVPSNLMLHRYGARVVITRILVTWGLVSMGTALVSGATSFYVARVLLGAAEAGFFPGIILFLTYFFPARERGRAIALFMTALAVAGVVGSPLSGLMLGLDGVLGLSGWQLMFVAEGVPAVLLAAAVWAYLPDRPDSVTWLDGDERRWLRGVLDEEQERKAGAAGSSLGHALRSGRLWLLALVYFGVVMSFYGVTLWLPQIVDGFAGLTSFQVGLVGAVPFAVAAIAMVANARHSDATGERRWHVAGPALFGAAGLVLSSLAPSPVLSLAALCVAAAGILSALPVFWTLPTCFLGGTAAAGGLAAINSVGNLGGFTGPYLVGLVKDRSGGFTGGLLFLAGMLVIAAALVIARVRRDTAEHPMTVAPIAAPASVPAGG